MGQPFPPGPPPNNPPGPGWGAPAGNPGWQPGPPRRPGGRSGADVLAVVFLLLTSLVYAVRIIWLSAHYGEFLWGNASFILAVIAAIAAAVLILAGGKVLPGRVLGAVAAGMVFAPSFGYILTALDRSTRRFGGLWANGGWLTIPATLTALVAIIALILAMTSGDAQQRPAAGGWPQQPPNAWPQPPMGGQPPAGYPAQHQPPPPQWPQQQ